MLGAKFAKDLSQCFEAGSVRDKRILYAYITYIYIYIYIYIHGIQKYYIRAMIYVILSITYYIYIYIYSYYQNKIDMRSLYRKWFPDMSHHLRLCLFRESTGHLTPLNGSDGHNDLRKTFSTTGVTTEQINLTPIQHVSVLHPQRAGYTDRS